MAKKEKKEIDDKEKKIEKASKIEKKKIVLKSEKIKRRDRKIKVLKLGLLINALFLIIVYFILRVMYSQGAFTVTLAQDFAKNSGIIIYDNLQTKQSKRILSAEKLEYMDNISYRWLPENIANEADGAHNGDNYIAYTFYIENQGDQAVNYWYDLMVDDVIKNVDKAIRVKVYRNDEEITYAKIGSNGSPEEGTVPFKSDKDVTLKERVDFKVGDIDKFTIVIWIEGDDLECTDELIGGQMKMHLEIDEERIANKEQ